MWKLLKWVNKNLILAIPIMMAAGFAYGVAFDARPLKSLIVPFTFLMVYPMMVNLNVRKVFEGGDGKAQLLTQAINFGIIPFVAFAAGKFFFPDRPAMALGLLLAGLVPTSGMTISWTGFAKGNMAAAVKMTVMGLIIGSLATPFYVQWLMGAELAVNMAAVMKQVGLIVFLPMAAGWLTRRTLVRHYGETEYKQVVAPKFPALSTVGVLGIVFIALALKARAVAAAPAVLPAILLPVGLVYLFNYALSTVVGRTFLPRDDAVALVYGSVMRNLSIALAIAINAFGKNGADAALVVAISYIIQVQSAAWYVRFSDRIFGAPVIPAESARQKSAPAAG